MADHDRARQLDEAEADLAAVEEALARLEAGTYFACEVCGADIGEERLVADPLTRRCADHATEPADATPAPPGPSPAGPSAGESPANRQPMGGAGGMRQEPGS